MIQPIRSMPMVIAWRWWRFALSIAILSFLSLMSVQSVSAQADASAGAAPWPVVNLLKIAGAPQDTELVQPLLVTHAGDGSNRLFVVGKMGKVHIIEDGEVLPTPFLDISDRISTCSECGLLGIAFPDNYESEGYFFVSYTSNANPVAGPPGEPSPTPGNDNVISRFRVGSNPDVALDAEEVVLAINQPYANHNGGMIAFGPDGNLYIGIGDGGSGGDPGNKGQSINSLLGKILRISVTGVGTYTVPADNPFAGAVPGRDEIWAYGLRNPWRFSFDRATGDLWIADVGQGLWEEVNLEPAGDAGGRNYGWRCYEGMHRYDTTSACDIQGATMPVWEYDHAAGQSITGGYRYRGNLQPEMQGIYIYGDYVSGAIWGLRRNGAQWENQELAPTSLSIASFGEDEQGELYVADLSGNAVYRFWRPCASGVGSCQFMPMVIRPAGGSQSVQE